MPTKITVTIEDELGDLSVAANGWKKQLTYTSWNGRDPKFDLRSWSVDHKSYFRNGKNFCRLAERIFIGHR